MTFYVYEWQVPFGDLLYILEYLISAHFQPHRGPWVLCHNNNNNRLTHTFTHLFTHTSIQVACGSSHTLAVSRDGRTTWSFGGGDNGKLGHGDTARVFRPKVSVGILSIWKCECIF